MTTSSERIAVYLEIGHKRTFAGGIDWPGWCRSGRDEMSALQTLFDYTPRYAKALRETRLEFERPTEVSALHVVERLEGNGTTDFGAPDIAPSSDAEPVGQRELERFEVLLKACWRAFDSAAKNAAGKQLRKGPRGGGRDLDQIIRHVLGGEAAYLGRISRRFELDEAADPAESLSRVRAEVIEGLAGSGMPERGPRGGARWSARYFVRRVAWHVLDHAWEIEDRSLNLS